MRLLVILTILVVSYSAIAKSVKYRKTQDVSFDGSEVDGMSRSPDGAYLLQKRGLKFMPLYKVRKKFDKEIKNSVRYLE
ncbi:MAG: hypothetical protein HOO06_11240 [Bdellovibrionaceae bacterium]|jgi:hypothetical protein|nr:hypothetical protein [Pseudobdellovibrionaceae bacterium]